MEFSFIEYQFESSVHVQFIRRLSLTDSRLENFHLFFTMSLYHSNFFPSFTLAPLSVHYSDQVCVGAEESVSVQKSKKKESLKKFMF